MKLETDRFLIRQISLTDKEVVFEYRADNERNKYQGWIPENVNDVETFIGKVAKQINEPETWFQFFCTALIHAIICLETLYFIRWYNFNYTYPLRL